MASAQLLYSQETVSEDEAPSTLWNWEIGDKEVDLFWDGYWKISFMGGLGAAWNEDEVIFPTQYPGLSSFLHMEQEPDILLSLWLDNRYYLETSFVNDYDKNSYALGYKGSEDQFIEHIRLSNSDLFTQGFGGISLSNPQYNTPGLLVTAAGNDSQHEMLLRMDGSNEESLIYQGYYRVDEEYLDLQQWEEGKYFLLPNINPDENTVRVYSQSSDGSLPGSDGLYYRLMAPGEYILNLDEGLISFPESQQGNILIFYRKNGDALGDLTLADNIIPSSQDQGFLVNIETALPFSWTSTDPFSPAGDFFQDTSQVLVDGRNCLLLKKSGHFSPFEFYNTYPLNIDPSTEDWRNQVQLVNRNSGEELNQPLLTAQWMEDYLRIYSTSNSDSIRSLSSRFPLAAQYPLLYGPGGQTEGEHQDSQLRIYTLNAEGNFKLPSGWVEGSLTITINGRSTTDFRVNQEGVIHFTRYILPRDRIVIQYRKENLIFQGSEVLFYQGSSLKLNSRQTLEWGFLTDWALPGDSEENEEGLIRLSAEHSYNRDLFQSEIHLNGDLKNPDTDGLLRLAGMEKDIQHVSIYPDVLQSSLNSFPELSLNSVDFSILEEYSYRDSNDQLQNYSYPYRQTTDEFGPSAALSMGTDDFDTPVMILPYDLAAGEWTGGSLMLAGKDEMPQDLSGLQELQFLIKLNSSDNSPDLRLILGESGEWEDHNGDDQLEPSSPASYVLRSLDQPASDGLWHLYRLVLNDEERSRLQRATAFTLILESTAADLSGDLIVGNIQLVGRGFNTAVLDSGGDIVQGDILAREQSDSTLQAAFPNAVSLFHSGADSQRIATISWGDRVDDRATALSPGESWQASTRLSQAVNYQYRNLTFYLKVEDDPPGGVYQIHFLDSAGRGIEISYIPDNSDWVEVRLDLVNRTIVSSGGTVSLDHIDSLQGSGWNRLVIEGTGSPSGELSIDEIYLSESIYELSSQVQWIADYHSEWSLESPGGFNYLSAFRIHSSAEGKQWSPLAAGSEREWSFNHQLESEAQVLLINLQLNLEYSLSDEKNRVMGGHEIKAPYFDFPVQFSEQFTMSDGQDDSYYTGEKSLLLQWAAWKNLNSYEYNQEDDRIKQGWNVDISRDKDSMFKLDWSGTAHLSSSEQGTYAPYTEQYMNSWQDLIPRKTEHLSRGSTLNQDIILETQPIALKSSLGAQSQGSFKPLWQQDNLYYSELVLPVRFSDRWSLSPFYNRNLSWRGDQREDELFSSDWNNYTEDFGNLLPLNHEIPFWELFQGDYQPLDERGNYGSQRFYSAETGMNWERAASASLKDLWLPVSLSAEFQREFTENGSFFSSEQYWHFKIKHQGQNLFGRFGLYPLFPFYLSGSFSSIWDIRLEGQNQSRTDFSSIDWDWAIDLKGNRESFLHWQNKWSLDLDEEEFSGSTGLSLGWRGIHKNYYRVPLSKQIIDRPFFMEHRSTANYKCTGNYDMIEKEELSVEQHWVMNFTDWGILDSWVALGYSHDDEYSMAGAETGIEIRITF